MTDTKALTLQEQRIGIFRQTLGNSIKAISSLLPQNMRPERIARIAIVELQKNPDLLNCTPHSFLLAVLGSCALGLELGGPLGQAYLIPYGKECQLIPGYRGLIKLAINSGQVTHIIPDVVRVGDRFEYETGSEQRLVHVPAEAPIVDGRPDPKWKPGEAKAFYSVAYLSGGFKVITVMQRWEVDRIRDMSKSRRGDKDPWVAHYDEMGKKTVIRRQGKILPASAERLQYALALEDAADTGTRQPFEVIPGMPEVPEPEPTVGETPPVAEQPKEKTDDEKKREAALQGLIIEMSARGTKTKEDQLVWINEMLPSGRSVTSRKELTTDDIGALMAQLKKGAGRA